MGQAKARGTFGQRKSEAEKTPKPRRLSASERDALIREATLEFVGKILSGSGLKL